MSGMTSDRLEELRRIAEAATPGPWELVRLAGYSGPYALKRCEATMTTAVLLTSENLEEAIMQEIADAQEVRSDDGNIRQSGPHNGAVSVWAV